MDALIEKGTNTIIRVGTGVVLMPEKPVEWVACPSNVTTAWTYDGSTFTPPPPPTQAELDAIAAAQAQAALDATAKADLKADNLITAMAGRTPLQNYNYVQTQVDAASVANVATAKASIDELAKLVGKLAAVVGVQARDL